MATLSKRPVFIAGSGSFLPGEPIPFNRIGEVLGELERTPIKTKRWMETTSIVMEELLDVRFFHYAIDPKTREFTDDNISMSKKACEKALDAAKLKPRDIDLICYGSAHQDQMPTASARLQGELGIETCAELAIHANCTSAYKALFLAHKLISCGEYDNALVVSSNIASSELRAEYYNQELVDKESLFLRWFLCDGAGALVLTSDQKRNSGFEVEHTYIESIGGKREPLMYNLRPALWLNPKEEYEKGLHHLRQQFRNSLSTEVFQEPGGSIFINGLKRMIEKSSVDLGSIKLFQVNLPAKHIVDSVMDELDGIGIPRQTVYTKLSELGYSGPPMVFICLDKIIREETLKEGDRIASFVTEVSKFMQAGYIVRFKGRASTEF